MGEREPVGAGMARLASLFVISAALGCATYLLFCSIQWRPAERESPPFVASTTRGRGQPPATPRPTLERPASRTRPAPPAPRRSAAERIEDEAAAALADEELTPEEVDALVSEALSLMLPDRVFTPSERARLAAAVLRIRAARRVLRRVRPSAAAAPVLARERQELTSALAEFEEITGLPPSELTEILEPGGGLSNDEEPGEEPSAPDGGKRPPVFLKDLER